MDEAYTVLPETNSFSVDSQYTLLYSTYLRLSEPNYNLHASRSNMRPPDQSNFLIAVTFQSVKDECYDDLPVLYNNRPMFITPGNRILKSVGTPLKCSDILPSIYVSIEW
jgi:hypothetical protein